MSRVITFSRVFPSYHPRKGVPTNFVEKICNSFISLGYSINEIDELCYDSIGLDESIDGFKHHTIRAGHRWKVGDWFSPRVWSGRPYNSQQIKLSDDVQIKKIWNINIDECGVWSIGLPGAQNYYTTDEQADLIAKNDGLSETDLHFWFNKIPFSGQIICWNSAIEY